MISSCPRLVVAGTHSGVGKTSVTLALVSALKQRGLKVQCFKVGPDYLDPTYLKLASNRPCYNLDGWMMGRRYVQSLFTARCGDADIAVVEGVMGLYDGAYPTTPEGSTAELARWLEAPVILVVNVHGMAGSVAALVKGYAELDGAPAIRGVIANRCGSDVHREWIREAVRAFHLPMVVGTVPRGAFPDLRSRHLGLVTADGRNLATATLTALGATLEAHASVDEILRIARSPVARTRTTTSGTSLGRTAEGLAGGKSGAEEHAGHVEVTTTTAFPCADPSRVRLGVAFDEAFHFYYQDNLDALEAGGAELVRFSPVHDVAVPVRLDALYLGGGYPEEHAHALSKNESMLESVREFVKAGRPVYAECGGLMYLSQAIERLDGTHYAQVGLLPCRTRMLRCLKSLGYVEVTLAADSLFGPEGSRLRGHEFHYSELVNDPLETDDWQAVYRAQRRRGGDVSPEGFQRGNVLASYCHLHFASCPGAVEHFLGRCRV
ncbi:MAG: cobyrinate a,c-diamide synthase [Thermodesulfobacteriota bacterium]